MHEWIFNTFRFLFVRYFLFFFSHHLIFLSKTELIKSINGTKAFPIYFKPNVVVAVGNKHKCNDVSSMKRVYCEATQILPWFWSVNVIYSMWCCFEVKDLSLWCTFIMCATTRSSNKLMYYTFCRWTIKHFLIWINLSVNWQQSLETTKEKKPFMCAVFVLLAFIKWSSVWVWLR